MTKKPIFTKKHYIVIGSCLNKCNFVLTTPIDSKLEYENADKVIKYIINNLSDMLVNDNPRFDRDKFLIACGVVNV